MLERNHVHKRRTALKLIAGAGVAGLAGCLGDDDDDDSGDTDDDDLPGDDSDDDDGTTADDSDPGDDLEDEMLIYTAFDIEPVVDMFNDEYGVDVTPSVYTGPQTISRFESEAQAGEVQASLIVTSADGVEWVSDHMAEVPVPDHYDEILPDDVRDELDSIGVLGQSYPFLQVLRGTIYNSEAISGPPIAYDDFLSSEWDNTFVNPLYNMRRIYATLTRAGWSQEEATDYMVGLDENVAEYIDGVPANVQAIIGGQADVGIHLMGSFLRGPISQGAPVDIAYPEFVSAHYNAIGIAEEAPAPNLAWEFMSWITSESGQQAVQEELGFDPINPSFEHGFSEIQDRIDEYNPEIIPLIPAESEIDEVHSILTEAIDRFE